MRISRQPIRIMRKPDKFLLIDALSIRLCSHFAPTLEWDKFNRRKKVKWKNKQWASMGRHPHVPPLSKECISTSFTNPVPGSSGPQWIKKTIILRLRIQQAAQLVLQDGNQGVERGSNWNKLSWNITLGLIDAWLERGNTRFQARTTRPLCLRFTHAHDPVLLELVWY